VTRLNRIGGGGVLIINLDSREDHDPCLLVFGGRVRLSSCPSISTIMGRDVSAPKIGVFLDEGILDSIWKILGHIGGSHRYGTESITH
jgi:hypothetical protein